MGPPETALALLWVQTSCFNVVDVFGRKESWTIREGLHAHIYFVVTVVLKRVEMFYYLFAIISSVDVSLRTCFNKPKTLVHCWFVFCFF